MLLLLFYCVLVAFMLYILLAEFLVALEYAYDMMQVTISAPHRTARKLNEQAIGVLTNYILVKEK